MVDLVVAKWQNWSYIFFFQSLVVDTHLLSQILFCFSCSTWPVQQSYVPGGREGEKSHWKKKREHERYDLSGLCM